MKNKIDISREISKRTGYRMSDINIVLTSMNDVLQDFVENGEECRIGFLTIGTKTISEKRGYDNFNFQEYVREEHVMPYAKIGETFKRKFREK